MRGVLYLLVGMVNVFDEGFPSEGEDVENDGGGFLRSLDDKSFDGFVKKKISMHAWVNGSSSPSQRSEGKDPVWFLCLEFNPQLPEA